MIYTNTLQRSIDNSWQLPTAPASIPTGLITDLCVRLDRYRPLFLDSLTVGNGYIDIVLSDAAGCVFAGTSPISLEVLSPIHTPECFVAVTLGYCPDTPITIPTGHYMLNPTLISVGVSGYPQVTSVLVGDATLTITSDTNIVPTDNERGTVDSVEVTDSSMSVSFKRVKQLIEQGVFKKTPIVSINNVAAAGVLLTIDTGVTPPPESSSGVANNVFTVDTSGSSYEAVFQKYDPIDVLIAPDLFRDGYEFLPLDVCYSMDAIGGYTRNTETLDDRSVPPTTLINGVNTDNTFIDADYDVSEEDANADNL